jgi:hypothetical protein
MRTNGPHGTYRHRRCSYTPVGCDHLDAVLVGELLINPELRMGQRHFGFAELRHYYRFALTDHVAAKLKCRSLCKA